MSFQNMSFSNMSFALLSNEIVRSSSTKCIYCYEKNHLYKKECVKFNENLRTKKIHLQKKRIHFDFYSFETFHVQMIFYKSQRQCVENAEKLIYSNRVVAASIEVHTIRLKKNAKIEFFIDEKKKKSFSWITNFTQMSTSFWLQRDQSLKFLRNLLNITSL
jgi:hypothetical protein